MLDGRLYSRVDVISIIYAFTTLGFVVHSDARYGVGLELTH